jgi:hypothetical protein
MSRDTEPATPGQKRLGRGMEIRLEVGMSFWDSLTREEATDRIRMLRALSSCVADRDKAILQKWDGGRYWGWGYDPNRPVLNLLDLLQ